MDLFLQLTQVVVVENPIPSVHLQAGAATIDQVPGAADPQVDVGFPTTAPLRIVLILGVDVFFLFILAVFRYHRIHQEHVGSSKLED